ncbi:unnamed protein product, partial [Phaeothamnion confervicola]
HSSPSDRTPSAIPRGSARGSFACRLEYLFSFWRIMWAFPAILAFITPHAWSFVLPAVAPRTTGWRMQSPPLRAVGRLPNVGVKLTNGMMLVELDDAPVSTETVVVNTLTSISGVLFIVVVLGLAYLAIKDVLLKRSVDRLSEQAQRAPPTRSGGGGGGGGGALPA